MWDSTAFAEGDMSSAKILRTCHRQTNRIPSKLLFILERKELQSRKQAVSDVFSHTIEKFSSCLVWSHLGNQFPQSEVGKEQEFIFKSYHHRTAVHSAQMSSVAIY